MQPQSTIPQTPQNSGSFGLQGTLPETPPETPKNKGDGLKGALATIAILLAAPLVAVALTAFVFQSYEVDGPSMRTTLSDHDRLIVLKLPKTFARIAHKNYIPKRGDIIIFKKTGLQQYGDTQEEKQLIKRVIGLPGDHVVVKDGFITIYNTQHPDGFNPDKEGSWGKVIVSTNGAVDLTVPEGEIFACGDNRLESLDSRFFGPVPSKDIVGKLVLRVFPISQTEKF